MKKIFTLLFAFLGFSAIALSANAEDIFHVYVPNGYTQNINILNYNSADGVKYKNTCDSNFSCYFHLYDTSGDAAITIGTGDWQNWCQFTISYYVWGSDSLEGSPVCKGNLTADSSALYPQGDGYYGLILKSIRSK